jgi:hypothetical protein
MIVSSSVRAPEVTTVFVICACSPSAPPERVTLAAVVVWLWPVIVTVPRATAKLLVLIVSPPSRSSQLTV